VKTKIPDIIARLYSAVPSGVGSKGDIKLSSSEEKK